MTKKLTETERIRRELKGHDKIRWIDGEREEASKELTKEGTLKEELEKETKILEEMIEKTNQKIEEANTQSEVSRLKSQKERYEDYKELTKEEIIEIENRYQVTDEERERAKRRAKVERIANKIEIMKMREKGASNNLDDKILREWREQEEEARRKMMKAKSKQTVKKWSREMQICGMNIRELEREKKESEDKQRI